MSNSILYSNAFVTMDSATLGEAVTVRINKNPNLNPVATMAKAFAGVTLGAAVCEITLECAVPAADFELNPDPFMVIGKLVEVGVVMANRQMTSKMFISGADYSGGVNQSSGVSISLIGPLTPWE